MNSTQNELRASYFKIMSWHLNRCLAPGIECTAPAIKAHSIQNSKVMDLLVRNGKVRTPIQRIEKKIGPVVLFKDVGRNQATTFAGFCSAHDSNIFKPIEINTIEPSNLEHLFLLAFRAVVRELYAVMEGASKIQSAYQRRIEGRLDSGNEPEPAGILAAAHMINAYETYLYKERFDQAFASKQYESILHDVIEIGHEEASIAVCSLFSLDEARRDDDCVRVALNILPLNEKNR